MYKNWKAIRKIEVEQTRTTLINLDLGTNEGKLITRLMPSFFSSTLQPVPLSFIKEVTEKEETIILGACISFCLLPEAISEIPEHMTNLSVGTKTTYNEREIVIVEITESNHICFVPAEYIDVDS